MAASEDLRKDVDRLREHLRSALILYRTVRHQLISLMAARAKGDPVVMEAVRGQDAALRVWEEKINELNSEIDIFFTSYGWEEQAPGPASQP